MAKRIKYIDDDRDPVRKLLARRIPSLAVGLALGVLISFMVSRFEQVLATDVRVAFFLPFIVYMAAAVGTQTQEIYTSDLRTGHASFKKYLIKESALGLLLGAIFGLVSWGVVYIWIGQGPLANAVGLAMFAAIFTAPIVALLVAEVLELEHQDPAIGAGPIATVIQDTISVVIYGLIATAIILG